MLGIVETISCGLLVLTFTGSVSELLDESCKLALDVAAQGVFGQLGKSLDLHGA